jgi:hypothetical protein
VLGVLLILLGTWMTLQEWKNAKEGEIKTRKDALGPEFEGFAKLLEALKYYPTGQRLIVFGIVILIIGGLIGGFGGLVS